MTVQEIKDLIASKIAGQGSAVDAGSALPEILNGIVDAIAAIPEVQPVYLKTTRSFTQLVEQGEISVTSMASYMGVTEKTLRQFLAGQIPCYINGYNAYNVMLQNARINDELYIGLLELQNLDLANPVVSAMSYNLVYDKDNDTVQFIEY